ncbi:prenyltransferase/squalene oxidase repeat-containing protein [Aeromicrobium sp.]|uniref:prenyltransferase/squalene oxidase repeat-containing protein n=1 Tax=Aeromicrobium sp. TaxID=1871063 RepID=UPI0025C227FF|nr:prenyltransferase/squalene oxidase repeat-containing protein [Aeromicrobium sp.]MCK5890434.1 terpene cyclase/mutase family protein [Aeromicrobium sp.]
MTVRRSRLAALAIGAVALPVLLAPSAGAAPSATSGQEVADAGAWLAPHVASGVYSYDSGFGDYPDYGLSLDIVSALHQLGVQPAAQAAVLDGLAAEPEAYGVGSAGGAGKLATVLQQTSRDASDLGGRDVLAEVVDMVVTDAGPELGRGVDASPWGDYSSGFTQPFVVSALSLAGDPLADDATDFLTRQQCADGGFRDVYSEVDPTTFANAAYLDPATSCESDLDSTLFAMTALQLAQAEGAAGLGTNLSDATTYLLAQQSTDGSFDGAGFAGTNSTGQAARVLAVQGQAAAALKAADWVRGRFVTPALAPAGSPLAGEVGAFAKDSAQFTDALTYGIEPAQRHEWVRASSQAALALQINPASGSVVVTGAPAEASAGSDVALTLSGLAPHETVQVQFESSAGAGRSVGFAAVALPTTVVANAAGTATVSVTLPAALGPQSILVTGLGTGRTGTVDITVLAAAPGDGTTGGGTAGGGAEGSGAASDATAARRDGRLPDTGAPVDLLLVTLAAAAVAAGAVIVRRARA